MQKTILAITVLAIIGVANAASIQGGVSQRGNVEVGPSAFFLGGNNAPGVGFGGASNISLKFPSDRIRTTYNNAPINVDTNENVDGTLNPKYVHPIVYNPAGRNRIGQVWYEKRFDETEVFSMRKIRRLPFNAGPKFTGITFAKVNTDATDLYFGEWSPQANPLSQDSNSTDLKFNNEGHTVWFVGDKPTGNTSGLATANYKVLGINQHVPGNNDFYTGTLTANFSAETLNGAISRGNTDNIDFNGTEINNTDGTFKKGDEITGRFYGAGAAALAGHTTNDDHSKEVAFGGAKE